MASFIPKLKKTAEGGEELRLCVDGHAAWFVERPDDRERHVNPLGAFRSEEAARRWVDRHFPGGEWQPA